MLDRLEEVLLALQGAGWSRPKHSWIYKQTMASKIPINRCYSVFRWKSEAKVEVVDLKTSVFFYCDGKGIAYYTDFTRSIIFLFTQILLLLSYACKEKSSGYNSTLQRLF